MGAKNKLRLPKTGTVRSLRETPLSYTGHNRQMLMMMVTKYTNGVLGVYGHRITTKHAEMVPVSSRFFSPAIHRVLV